MKRTHLIAIAHGALLLSTSTIGLAHVGSQLLRPVPAMANGS